MPARRISRRAFLAGLGGTTVYVVAQRHRLLGLIVPSAALPSNPNPVRVISALRRSDLLNATFRFYDVSFSFVTQGVERFGPSGAHPTLVVELPPQAIGEQTFLSPPAANTKAKALLAGPTRLAFVISEDELYTSSQLLDWFGWSLRTTPNRDPSLIETAIESPWGLVIAPRHQAPTRFIAHQAVTRSGITGLWHGELTYVDEDGFPAPGHPNEIVAVTNRTLATQNGNDLFDLPLTPSDRTKIVDATQGVGPARSRSLLVTPLGASLDVRGDWRGNPPRDDSGAPALTHWRHVSTIGRDHYVRIVEKGFLYPFGNRASEVTVTERTIQADGRAYLIKRAFIVVKQPEIDYDATPTTERFGGRAWPFRKVRITTLTSPDIKLKSRETIRYTDYADVPAEDPFWVQATDGSDVMFGVIATDADGNQVEFSLPMIFGKISKRVDSASGRSITYYPDQWDLIHQHYQNLPMAKGASSSKRSRPRAALAGQQVAVAPSAQVGDATGGAAYPTASILIGATRVAGIPGGGNVPAFLRDQELAPFHPELQAAEVKLDQVETISATSGKTATIGLNTDYLNSGYGPLNPAGVFADMLAPIGVNFPVDRTGGLATPNLSIKGLTRDLGPVGDVASFIGTHPIFDPEQYFPKLPSIDSLVPMLLGDLKLPDVLSTGDAVTAPKITTTFTYPGGNRQRPPESQETRLDWVPILKDLEIAGSKVFDTRNGQSELEIHGFFASKFAVNAQPVSDINGELREFDLALGPIVVKFNKVRFESTNGSKPDIDVDVLDVEFRDPLKFVNELRDLMKKPPGSPGLAIQVDSKQIGATYNLGIPDLAIGVFAMKNMTMIGGITIPLKGDEPTIVKFDFGTVDNPFLVSYAMFAGSGYFGIELAPRGIRAIRASIGVGAAVALAFGPLLSGNISIMAGFSFELEVISEDERKIKLAGFLTVKGSASVLGLVTVSIMLFLTLDYEPEPNKLTAKGVLVIEVDLTLFSKTISKTVTYSFGKGADPTLAQVWTNDDWSYYAGAFAPTHT